MTLKQLLMELMSGVPGGEDAHDLCSAATAPGDAAAAHSIAPKCSVDRTRR